MIRSLATIVLTSAIGTAVAFEADPDPSFSVDGMYTVALSGSTSHYDEALRTLVDSQGRYVVVGYVDYAQIGLMRMLPNGDGDPTYAGGGAVTYPIPGNVTLTDAVMDEADRVVVVGYGLNPLDNDPFVCRFKRDGEPDVAFGASGCHFIPIDITVNGEGDDRIYAAAIYKEDIFLVGSVERNDPGDFDFLVMRLLFTNGQLRTTFGNSGYVTVPFDLNPNHAGGDDDRASAILIVGDDIYVGGYADLGGFNGKDFAVAKLEPSEGILDPTFCPNSSACSGSGVYKGKRTFDLAPDGYIYDDRVTGLALAPDGAIVVAGESYSSLTDVIVTKFDATSGNLLHLAGNHSNHQRFHGLSEDRVPGLAVRSDGAIYVSGTFAVAPAGNGDPQHVFWID